MLNISTQENKESLNFNAKPFIFKSSPKKRAESQEISLANNDTDCSSTGASDGQNEPSKHQRNTSLDSWRHEVPEVKEPQRHRRLVKMAMCPSLNTGSPCEYGVTCKFAHSEADLGNPVILYKTKMKLCKDFHKKGFCESGDSCEYVHSQLKLNTYEMKCKKFEESDLKYSEILKENT